jgi:hypothetical protein
MCNCAETSANPLFMSVVLANCTTYIYLSKAKTNERLDAVNTAHASNGESVSGASSGCAPEGTDCLPLHGRR